MKARRVVIGAAILILALAGAGFLYARAQRPTIALGVGYGARVACGCRFIEGRALSDCYKDFEPGMESISLSENVKDKSVTASVLFIASRTVRFDPVLGCQPETYRR